MGRFWSVLPILLLLSACAVSMPDTAPSFTPPVPLDPSVAAPIEMAPEAPKAVQAQAPVAKPVKPRRVSLPPKSGEPPVPDDLAQQPIEELVIRPDDLTGYWMLIAPRVVDVDIGLFSGVQIRYGGEMGRRNICWLQQKGHSVSALCAAGTVLKSGSGSVDGEAISMRWWMGAATANFSGKFTEAGKIAGGFSGGVVGVSVTGDVPASLYRLDPANPLPEPDRPSAALIKGVWEDVRRGQLTEGRYEGSAPKRVSQGLSKEIAAETPQSMLYLGRIVVRWRKEQRETLQDVYQVTTEAGRRLCRVAPNEKGQVIDFACQALDLK